MAVLASCLLAACTAFNASDRDHSFEEGWVRGRVVSVVAGDQLDHPENWSCTNGSTARERASSRYAVVSYRLPRPRQRVVALQPGQQVLAGERVWVNLDHCDNAVETQAVARTPTPAPPM